MKGVLTLIAVAVAFVASSAESEHWLKPEEAFTGVSRVGAIVTCAPTNSDLSDRLLTKLDLVLKRAGIIVQKKANDSHGVVWLSVNMVPLKGFEGANIYTVTIGFDSRVSVIRDGAKYQTSGTVWSHHITGLCNDSKPAIDASERLFEKLEGALIGRANTNSAAPAGATSR